MSDERDDGPGGGWVGEERDSRSFEARRRGYRDEDLADATAQRLMLHAIKEIEREALTQRQALLAMGFADDHKLCKELDLVAADWHDRFLAQRAAYPDLA